MNAQNPDELKVADLKAEIDKRNDGRADADKIPATGNKDDLVAAIKSDDERAARVSAIKGPSASPAVATAPDDVAEATEVVQDQVTLVHPEHKAEVTVLKPSADYTNYVRGYGYREQETK